MRILYIALQFLHTIIFVGSHQTMEVFHRPRVHHEEHHEERNDHKEDDVKIHNSEDVEHGEFTIERNQQYT